MKQRTKLPCFSAMRVPLLDLQAQYRTIAEPIHAAIEEVLATQRFILATKGKEFEEAICRFLAVPHAIGVSSGTDALLATLMALQIGPGDAILTSAYSFFATAASISRVGATPVFIDIDPATFNLSVSALRSWIDKHSDKARGKLLAPGGETVCAVMPVHLFGLCCAMDEMITIARKHDLLVIEDAAQALGAEYPTDNGPLKAGTMGDAGCFSFYPSKNLGAAGDAGLVACHNEDLARRLRICRHHGMGQEQYQHEFIGGNFRLDEMQAAVLNVKLSFVEQWAGARRAAADFYREEFLRRNLGEQIVLPAEPYRDRGLTNHHVYHQFVIRTRDRDELRNYLKRREIETAIYYPLGLHEQKCFAYLGYKAGDFLETERTARESLALPIYPEISREAQSYVVSSIAEFFQS
ncbi:MAG TPA: DegT/DnrJ/EryC1/StrS family aminotransferase [Chthoniobacterales bacterium]|nr:DegT/DnrJ/EryC1/StrS family aminotransferase [Chthoniobacterales bacterium]